MRLCVRVVPLVLVVCCSVSFSQPESGRRDGNWWIHVSPHEKLTYVVGFFDGMELGNRFSYWKMIDANKSDPCAARAVEAYGENKAKFFSNVTNDQLADGLDSFYSDYKNRRISVDSAVWLVVNGIAGTPRDKLEKMIESWRKNSK